MAETGAVSSFTFDVAADRQAAPTAPDKSNQVLMGRNDLDRFQQMQNQDPDSDELNPIVAEKRMRDAEFAAMAGENPNPEAVEQEKARRTDENKRVEKESKLFQLGAELDKWKAIAKRRKDDQSAMETRLRQLESRVNQNQPSFDVRQMTGKNPEELLTAGEVTNLMINLAGVFGQQIQGVRDEAAQFVQGNKSKAVSDVDEAELTYMHPWLEQLPVAQRERAMMDMLATRNQPPEPEPPPPPTFRQVEQVRSRVREANYIEASNRGSIPERTAQEPQQVAANQKIEELKKLLSKPGGSAQAGELLTALGAGPDDAEGLYLNRR